MTSGRLSCSFRDPSGFVFFRDGCLYRQVNLAYKDQYDELMSSGLYRALVNAELLIPHVEADAPAVEFDTAYKVIRPEMVPFVSYPYEWCFSQLKGAALITLKVQKVALDFGMSLRDSSAYNIQFRKGKPVLIDTLSFGKYREGHPWVGYRQFCQHFLAPLALMSYRDIRLNQLLRLYMDGVPLDLASSLLPYRTRFRFSLLSHIHLHARSQKHFSDKPVNVAGRKMSRLALLGLLDNLEAAVGNLIWQPQGTEWADYYRDTNYSLDAFNHKKQIVAEFLNRITPSSVWDLGANVGIFSRIASDRGIMTVSFDIDPAAVERNYGDSLTKGETNILPLVLDLTNPSPNIGWRNQERVSLVERGPVDCVFALALIHHLAISNNLPLGEIAGFLSQLCRWLIIEFVPKSDSQVQRLLATRDDIFTDYTQSSFEAEFSVHFVIKDSVSIKNSARIVYLMERRSS